MEGNKSETLEDRVAQPRKGSQTEENLKAAARATALVVARYNCDKEKTEKRFQWCLPKPSKSNEKTRNKILSAKANSTELADAVRSYFNPSPLLAFEALPADEVFRIFLNSPLDKMGRNERFFRPLMHDLPLESLRSLFRHVPTFIDYVRQSKADILNFGLPLKVFKGSPTLLQVFFGYHEHAVELEIENAYDEIKREKLKFKSGLIDGFGRVRSENVIDREIQLREALIEVQCRILNEMHSSAFPPPKGRRQTAASTERKYKPHFSGLSNRITLIAINELSPSQIEALTNQSFGYFGPVLHETQKIQKYQNHFLQNIMRFALLMELEQVEGFVHKIQDSLADLLKEHVDYDAGDEDDILHPRRLVDCSYYEAFKYSGQSNVDAAVDEYLKHFDLLDRVDEEAVTTLNAVVAAAKRHVSVAGRFIEGKNQLEQLTGFSEWIPYEYRESANSTPVLVGHFLQDYSQFRFVNQKREPYYFTKNQSIVLRLLHRQAMNGDPNVSIRLILQELYGSSKAKKHLSRESTRAWRLEQVVFGRSPAWKNQFVRPSSGQFTERHYRLGSLA